MFELRNTLLQTAFSAILPTGFHRVVRIKGMLKLWVELRERLCMKNK